MPLLEDVDGLAFVLGEGGLSCVDLPRDIRRQRVALILAKDIAAAAWCLCGEVVVGEADYSLFN